MSHKDELPEHFPTHLHQPEFWEELGRVVGTFGFLEETLRKAIFAYTATHPYSEDEIEKAYEAWPRKLERALHDPLGNLIDEYSKAVREHQETKVTLQYLEKFTKDLQKVSKLRNMLCHGSWRPPDGSGASVPFFVNRQLEINETPIDVDFLRQTQEAVSELACKVICTVTHMGWQFPGATGPGKSLLWN